MDGLSMSYQDHLREERDSITSILSKVQDDLRHIREELQSQIISGNHVDVSSLQTALGQIESTIVERTEAVVKTKFSKIRTLPFALSDGKHITTTRDTHYSRSRPLPPISYALGSPGQAAQLQYISKLLNQPSHPATRQVLSDAFGIPSGLEVIKTRGRHHPTTNKGTLVSGSTVRKSHRLIGAKRYNVLSSPPIPISSSDANKGILNLVERGLIPKSADIVLNPAPVQPKTLTLNKFSKDVLKVPPMDNTKGGGLWTGIKFDYSGYSRIPLPNIPTVDSTHSKKSQAKIEATSGATLTVQTLNVLDANQDEEEQEDKEIGYTYSLRSSVGSNSKLIIRAGHLLENEVYTGFKEKNQLNWHLVQRIIDLIEEMAQNYAIPIIFISAEKALLLGEEYDLEPRPCNKELLSCVLNSRDVAHLLTSPGRRYKGRGGVHMAVAKIQATYRMAIERRKYLTYRKMKWASSVIAIGWMLYMKAKRMKLKLRDISDRQLGNYRNRINQLGVEWDTFHSQKRVVIHVPSKGYLAHIRRAHFQFPLSQNFQLPRILDAIDPRVELIYILPIEIGKDVEDYYRQLLINTRGLKKGQEAWDRIHFILPEAMKSFTNHPLSLSSFLRYSPLALRQIRNIIGQSKAVLIPHVPYQEDIAVGEYFNIPVLASDPGSVRLYTSFAGRRLLFSSANVQVPPYAVGIRTNDQLVESLAWLVVNYPTIRRWLFKLDYYCHGQGIAYCDVADYLDCHGWIIKEKKRYGNDKWKKQWAQETARQRVMSQLSEIIHTYTVIPTNDIHSSWPEFYKEFISYGGSIEGYPPSDNVTSLTSDLLLKPNGSYTILSTWDHIHTSTTSPFTVWGGSIPQCSVNNGVLSDVVKRIAQAGLARGLVGHMSIDYLTFIDPDTMSQVVWAVDIDFGPSDIVYMKRLSCAAVMSSGGNNSNDDIQWSPYGEEERGRGSMLNGRTCFGVASTRLYHTNLSLVEYSVFFQMCKAHLIGYNEKTNTGTLFALIESQKKHNLGMICIQSKLKDSLMSASHTLSVLHQEVGSSSDSSQLLEASKIINGIIDQMEQTL